MVNQQIWSETSQCITQHCIKDFTKLRRLYLKKINCNGKLIVPVRWIEHSINIIQEHLHKLKILNLRVLIMAINAGY